MTEETKVDDLEGIPLVHQSIAREHGRDCYNLAMVAGLATEGLSRLDELAEKHRSKHGGMAVIIVQQQLNKLLAAMLVFQGITQAQVKACQAVILSTPVAETPRVQVFH